MRIECRGVVKRYGAVKALAGADLRLRSGQVVAIVGGNGSGKTTLLDVMTARTRYEEGECDIDGRAVGGLRSDQVARLGVVRTFQKTRLVELLTVREHVLLARDWTTRRSGRELLAEKAAREARVGQPAYWLERFGLRAKGHRLSSELSFGERRLLSLATCWSARPNALLLDEPLSGLQANVSRLVEREIEEAARSGCLVAMIEHDLAAVQRLADRVIVLDSGLVTMAGEPAEVMTSEALERSYFG